MGGVFTTTHKLRFSDGDPVGHINNAVYSVMFEAGRTDLMQAAGIYEIPGRSMVIVRLEIDFKREMSWPGDVVIETAVERVGAKSIHMRQQLLSRGEPRASALAILAAIDRETRRAVPLDQSWHDRFAPWMHTA
jgi:acyl-CoA thioester hydrolase